MIERLIERLIRWLAKVFGVLLEHQKIRPLREAL